LLVAADNLRLLEIFFGRGGQGFETPGPLFQTLSPNPLSNIKNLWAVGRGVCGEGGGPLTKNPLALPSRNFRSILNLPALNSAVAPELKGLEASALPKLTRRLRRGFEPGIWGLSFKVYEFSDKIKFILIIYAYGPELKTRNPVLGTRN
jgi:hypothetical protein